MQISFAKTSSTVHYVSFKSSKISNIEALTISNQSYILTSLPFATTSEKSSSKEGKKKSFKNSLVLALFI